MGWEGHSMSGIEDIRWVGYGMSGIEDAGGWDMVYLEFGVGRFRISV